MSNIYIALLQTLFSIVSGNHNRNGSAELNASWQHSRTGPPSNRNMRGAIAGRRSA